MKSLIFLTLMLGGCNFVFAEDDPFGDGKSDGPPTPPRHVRIQVKLIETSQTELTKIISNPQPLQENLYRSIKRLMKLDKAKLIHQTVVVARAGEKATAESICEMIFPSDYEPPGHGFIPPKSGDITQGFPYTPSVRPYGSPPCAFETRNVGDTLEVESQISNDSKTIDLRFAHDRVKFNRYITYVTHKDQWGKSDIFYPEFSVQRTAAAITLANRETRFISTYTPLGKDKKPDPSRKILVFVKATIITPR